MAQNKSMNATKAILQLLRPDDSDSSCDENEDITSQAIAHVLSGSSDSSDTESTDPADSPASANNTGRGQPSNNQWDALPTRAEITWKRISNNTVRGRAAAKNVFSGRPGPTSYSHRGIQLGSPLSAFRLFIDEPMLRSIQKFTVNHGKAENESFTVELCKLEKFIGIQIARGVLAGKNTPIQQLCGVRSGVSAFLEIQ